MTQQFQVKATSFLYLKPATHLRKRIPVKLFCSAVATVKASVLDAIIAP